MTKKRATAAMNLKAQVETLGAMMLNHRRLTNALIKNITATATPLVPDAARFIQCFVQTRGPYGVLHALDGTGQVWELHTVMDGATKKVTEQFWTPLGMERRKP